MTTFRVSLTMADGMLLSVVVEAADEDEARAALIERFPGCTIDNVKAA